MMRDSVEKKEKFNLRGSSIILLIVIGMFFMSSHASAVTTKRMWSSPTTGHAIDGYDPVAYFTQARARKGIREHEYVWAGVAWRFVNEGNLDAFKRNPDIYAPQLGSYALDGLLSNVLIPPNPLQWALYNKKLYLFNSSRAKKKFEKNVSGNLYTASENWKILIKSLNE